MGNDNKTFAVPLSQDVYDKKYYLKIGSAGDLTGRDKIIYRLFEILPGFLSWLTLFSVLILSWLTPVFVAIFIITFDVYWLIKTFFLSIHLRANWKRVQKNLKTDWKEKLNELSPSFGYPGAENNISSPGEPKEKWKEIWQMVIMPFYKESFEVVSEGMEGLFKANWLKEKMIVVLAYEERAGENAEITAKSIEERYKDKFGHFIMTKHPKDLPNEISGKGSNIHYAAKAAKKEIVEKYNLDPGKILVSSFDIDTVVYPDYFLVITYNFLTSAAPFNSSFQPVPVYNNNIWQTPFFSRVAATSSTFWQMMQQERPERLATFSSHSINFKTLSEVDFWQTNMVSEDSRIFWNLLLHNNGNYKVIPLSYLVSMDANLGKNFWQTAKNVYKQQRRWTWGVENIPYILFGFLKNKEIPFRKKLRFSFVQLEGFWSLATSPILIFLLGWFPLVVGGQEFNNTLLSYNLPRITRSLMTLAMLGLISSAIISTSLLPPRPANIKKRKYISMVLQWICIPFTIIIFGAIPGLEAQTRLMLGGKFRLGFWVTPKFRKNNKNST